MEVIGRFPSFIETRPKPTPDYHWIPPLLLSLD